MYVQVAGIMLSKCRQCRRHVHQRGDREAQDSQPPACKEYSDLCESSCNFHVSGRTGVDIPRRTARSVLHLQADGIT